MFALSLLFTTVFVASLGQSADARPNYIPSKGIVPNQKTAVRIAKAVLIPLYGEEEVKSEEPFVVILKGGVWIIHGPIRPGPGGNLYIEISKKSGCILRLYGTQ